MECNELYLSALERYSRSEGEISRPIFISFVEVGTGLI